MKDEILAPGPNRGKFPRCLRDADRASPDLSVPFISIKTILHAVITEVQSVLKESNDCSDISATGQRVR